MFRLCDRRNLRPCNLLPMLRNPREQHDAIKAGLAQHLCQSWCQRL
jgi:hypothetical protein